MSTISGVGSGAIDVNSIVSQLMSIERQPLQKLQTRLSGMQTEVSAFGQPAERARRLPGRRARPHFAGHLAARQRHEQRPDGGQGERQRRRGVRSLRPGRRQLAQRQTMATGATDRFERRGDGRRNAAGAAGRPGTPTARRSLADPDGPRPRSRSCRFDRGAGARRHQRPTPESPRRWSPTRRRAPDREKRRERASRMRCACRSRTGRRQLHRPGRAVAAGVRRWPRRARRT